MTKTPHQDHTLPATPWLTVAEAAQRSRVGVRLIYREAAAGRLRHAVVGGRRSLRFKAEWIDEWLERTAEPVEIAPQPLRMRVG